MSSVSITFLGVNVILFPSYHPISAEPRRSPHNLRNRKQKLFGREVDFLPRFIKHGNERRKGNKKQQQRALKSFKPLRGRQTPPPPLFSRPHQKYIMEFEQTIDHDYNNKMYRLPEGEGRDVVKVALVDEMMLC